jgi:hypothetical protein
LGVYLGGKLSALAILQHVYSSRKELVMEFIDVSLVKMRTKSSGLDVTVQIKDIGGEAGWEKILADGPIPSNWGDCDNIKEVIAISSSEIRFRVINTDAEGAEALVRRFISSKLHGFSLHNARKTQIRVWLVKVPRKDIPEEFFHYSKPEKSIWEVGRYLVSLLEEGSDWVIFSADTEHPDEAVDLVGKLIYAKIILCDGGQH